MSKDGHVSILMKNGQGLHVISTNDMGDVDTQFSIERGRMGKDDVILGKYVNDTITVDKDLAMDHEFWHFFMRFLTIKKKGRRLYYGMGKHRKRRYRRNHRY